MDFFDVIRQRHSIRTFKPTPVEEGKLHILLEAANAAPSAGNLQGYEIYLVRQPEDRRRLAEAAYGQEFIYQAPVVLVFLANPQRSAPRYGRRGAELYSIQDATIACTFAHLSAVALNLASTWVGAFNDAEVKKALGNPPGLHPVAILPIGYPAESPFLTSRRPLNDIVREYP